MVGEGEVFFRHRHNALDLLRESAPQGHLNFVLGAHLSIKRWRPQLATVHRGTGTATDSLYLNCYVKISLRLLHNLESITILSNEVELHLRAQTTARRVRPRNACTHVHRVVNLKMIRWHERWSEQLLLRASRGEVVVTPAIWFPLSSSSTTTVRMLISQPTRSSK